MNLRFPATLIFFFLFLTSTHSQVVINEVQSSNFSTLNDEFGSQDDWIELHNTSAVPIDLNGFQLSDDLQQPGKFIFPAYELQANDHVVVIASGFEKKEVGGHWETPVYGTDVWKYRVNTSAPPDTNWRNLSFNDNAWSSGAGGIGYGDGDDNTTIPQCISIYMRRVFTVADTSKISAASLNIDFDDAFVAYLNGVEIARSNIGTSGVRPAWNAASTTFHEAVMYQGMNPDSFLFDHNVVRNALVTGINVFAVEIHNYAANNQDLTAIPFLNFKIKDATTFFGPPPSWFSLGQTKDYFHAGFKLSRTGEGVFLFNGASVLVDSVTVPLLELDDAYARVPDGSLQWCFTGQPTPDTVNGGGICNTGYATIPLFSLQSGFYPNTQLLTITTNYPGGVIHYTTNGDTPDGASPIYTTPLTISSTTSVRARVYALNVLPSSVVTNTYLIDFDCKLPVYVLSTDSANLWDYYTGIFVEGPNAEPGNPHWGANYWMGWEKPVSLEYFDKDKNRAFRFNAGFRVTGGWSRADIQKPLEISLGDRYGLGELNYSLLSEKPWRDNFDNFILHTAGTDRGIAHMRDPLMERLLTGTHVDHISFEPCLLIINGQQWGVYYTRENDDHHFVEQNYGIEKEDIDLLKESYMYPGIEVKKGSDSAFFAMHSYAMNTSPTDSAFYSTMNTMMDIENMVDYFAAETFYPNGDWMSFANNNLKLWRQRSVNGRFRYICYDLDFGYGYSGGLNNDVLGQALAANPHNYQSDIFARLIQNPQYKNYFINRYADLINTIWLPSNVNGLAAAFRDSMRYDMHYQYEDGWYAGDTNQWNNNVDDMLNFAAQRPAYARGFIQSNLGMAGQVTLTLQVSPPGAGRIQISTITPETLPWSGVYFNGNPVTITAIPNPGYAFDHWLSNVIITTNDTNQRTSRNFSSSDQITAYFTGSPSAVELTISELNYNSDSARDAGDWVEIHNLSSMDTDISGWKLRDDQDHHVFTFPVNTVIPASGYLVVAEDLQKFAAWHPSVANVTGETGFNFGNGGDQVRLYDYRDTLYLSMSYADDLTWPQGADGGGYTLELVSASGNLSDGANWFDGCLGGSPGVAYSSGTASATASGATQFCAGGSVSLLANTGGGLTYQWQMNSQLIPGATNASFDATQSGLYSVIVTTNGCAAVSDSIEVEVMPAPAAPVVADIVNCGAGSFTLNAFAADSISWYDAPNGNLIATGGTYNTPLITATTVYYVQTSNICTSAFVPVSVVIMYPPADPSVIPGSRCGDGAVTLSASGNDTIFWYDSIGGVLLFTGTSFQTPVISATTTYYVTAGNFCPSNYVAVTATIFPLPVVYLGNDIITSTPVTLDAGAGFVAYNWSTAEITQTIVVNSTGNYWVIAEDQNGCTGSDTIHVQFTVFADQISGVPGIRVYPNPAHEQLVVCMSNAPGESALKLIDATGRIAWQGKGSSEQQTTYHLDLSTIARGIYLLRIESAESVSIFKISVK